MLLALVHAGEALVWFTLLILGAQIARGWLGQPAARRAMDRVTGTVLVAFGVELPFTDRFASFFYGSTARSSSTAQVASRLSRVHSPAPATSRVAASSCRSTYPNPRPMS